MENGKTIAERLRKIAAIEAVLCNSVRDAFNVGGDCAITCSNCGANVLNALADEIEAEQADLLERYENALAEQERTKSEQNGVDVTALLKVADRLDSVSNFGDRDPKWIFRKALCDWAASIRDAVKRPEPEVLDADGVPIKVGDTVYSILNPKCPASTVIEVSSTLALIENGNGKWDMRINELTHRKPDTQEALEADAAKDACTYFNGEGNKPRRCSDCPIGSDEDTDWDFCARSQKLDLLRRQRKLMGGE